MSSSVAKLSAAGALRLVIVLGLFPIALVYLLPQLPYAEAFFAGDRSQWLRFWATAAAFEWAMLTVVLLTFYGRREKFDEIGFPTRPGVATVIAAVIPIGGAVWMAAAMPGIPQETLERMPYGATMFLPPAEIGTRLFWVFMSFTAAFCEETLFRGVAITELKKLTGSAWVAVLVSCFAFAFFHGGFEQGAALFAARFAIALVLSGIYVWTKRLAPAMIVHFVLDASALAAS